MAISDFLNQMGVDIGGEGSLLSFSFVTDIIIFGIVAIIVGVFTYWYANKKSYDKTIVIYREINGQTRRMRSDRAKEITLPGTSVRAYYLKRHKFYMPRPSIETGENEFWYFLREDGEWMNVGVMNVNAKLKILELKFDHTDMRMANAALKRLIDQSYKKINWLKEWAPYIGFGLIIVMLGIFGYLIANESMKVVGAAAANVEALARISESLDGILGSLDNIASSSGVRSV